MGIRETRVGNDEGVKREKVKERENIVLKK